MPRERWVCSSGPSGRSIAGGPVGWFVAWEHDRQGSSYQDIHGRLVWVEEIFADGFEGGTMINWSSHVP